MSDDSKPKKGNTRELINSLCSQLAEARMENQQLRKDLSGVAWRLNVLEERFNRHIARDGHLLKRSPFSWVATMFTERERA